MSLNIVLSLVVVCTVLLFDSCHCQEDSLIVDVENTIRNILSETHLKSLEPHEIPTSTPITTSVASKSSDHDARLVDQEESVVGQINFDQIIIFNIGDASAFENISSPYKQKFDQESVNYCNFDPLLLSNKNSRKLTNYRGYEFSSSSATKSGGQQQQDDLNVNIFLKGDIFNRTSEITGIVLFQFEFMMFKMRQQLLLVFKFAFNLQTSASSQISSGI